MTSRAVSVVMPVHNGAATIQRALEAVFEQDYEHPLEVIAVDDAGTDDSREILERLNARWPLRIIDGPGRGAAAALNAGIASATHPLIAQIDQDVIVDRGWLGRLVAVLDDHQVAAAQGQYTTDARASAIGRAMSRDLEWRYASMTRVSHVCTGNTLYRASALHQIGLFDEALGYGYDNDLSYRLQQAGYRLVFCPDARSRHHWRDGLAGYLAQQYGFGYGRIDVVAKHPRRLGGDSVSPAPMMAHGVLTALALGLWAMAAVLAWWSGHTSGPLLRGGASIVCALALERAWASAGAFRRFRDPATLLFVPLHLLRDASWAVAIAVWSARRLLGRPARPAHSMRARSGGTSPRPRERRAAERPLRVLGIIPAHNEADNLAVVVSELRAACGELDLLVVNDGSTDSTEMVLSSLDVAWMSFPERLGIGSVMRAGLRYAARRGYDACVRIDGDGQHSASEIARLLAPIHGDTADVVLGSRYTRSARVNAQESSAPRRTSPSVAAGAVPAARPLQRGLGACLSVMTGARVTDPTSGFCAIGPRALRLLADHHPTGYPEPELRLFLSRNGLRAIEVPVISRPRLSGRTSLTVGRIAIASARVVIAMMVVPLRRPVKGGS